MKKIISLMMAMAMVLSMGAMSFADTAVTYDTTAKTGTGASDVQLTTEAATFSVTVPTTIAFSISANGTVTAPDNVKIINNSIGAVKVTNIAVANQNSWAGLGYDAMDPTKLKVDAKQYSLSINGDKMTADETITFTASNFPRLEGANATDSDELELTYLGKFAPQSTALNAASFAQVTYTLAWDTAA